MDTGSQVSLALLWLNSKALHRHVVMFKLLDYSDDVRCSLASIFTKLVTACCGPAARAFPISGLRNLRICQGL